MIIYDSPRTRSQRLTPETGIKVDWPPAPPSRQQVIREDGRRLYKRINRVQLFIQVA